MSSYELCDTIALFAHLMSPKNMVLFPIIHELRKKVLLLKELDKALDDDLEHNLKFLRKYKTKFIDSLKECECGKCPVIRDDIMSDMANILFYSRYEKCSLSDSSFSSSDSDDDDICDGETSYRHIIELQKDVNGSLYGMDKLPMIKGRGLPVYHDGHCSDGILCGEKLHHYSFKEIRDLRKSNDLTINRLDQVIAFAHTNI